MSPFSPMMFFFCDGICSSTKLFHEKSTTRLYLAVNCSRSWFSKLSFLGWLNLKQISYCIMIKWMPNCCCSQNTKLNEHTHLTLWVLLCLNTLISPTPRSFHSPPVKRNNLARWVYRTSSFSSPVCTGTLSGSGITGCNTIQWTHSIFCSVIKLYRLLMLHSKAWDAITIMRHEESGYRYSILKDTDSNQVTVRAQADMLLMWTLLISSKLLNSEGLREERL